MRRRYHVSWHQTHEEAVNAKEALLFDLIEKEQPIKDYQIRKKQNKFALMERLTTREATVIQEVRNANLRRPKRKRLSTVL